MGQPIATEKDRQIIRQSQSKLALEYFNACGVCPTLTDLIKTTTMLEDFVINGYSSTMIMKFEKLDAYIHDEYIGKK
jgi:hypothetical protein